MLKPTPCLSNWNREKHSPTHSTGFICLHEREIEREIENEREKEREREREIENEREK